MKRYILGALAAVLFLSCAREMDTPVDQVAPTPATGSVKPHKGAVVPGAGKILFSEEMVSQIEAELAEGNVITKSSALNEVVASLGITSMRRLFPDAGEYEERTRREGLHRWYKVTFDKDIPVTKAGEDLLSIPGVERFEKCLSIRSMASPNDTYYSYMWGLKNSNGYDVNVEPAWENFTVGNPDVIVCVVDGGIQLNHPDLAWNCASSGHYNYVDNNKTIYPHDHGSHVAGTIAAVTNNGRGVAGIAGGDYATGRRGITLLSHQIFKTVTKNGQTYDEGGDGETAIKEGADRGALISQNSWGYYFDFNENDRLDQEDIDAYQYYFEHPDAAFTAAVDYFVKYAGCDNQGNQLPNSLMKGGLVVFAAGNDNIPYGPPANYEPCIAVGAISSSGGRASFSDYGPWVDLCAPGVDIASTVPTNDYDMFSGTSMACPHVSGVAALVLSYCGGPGYTADDLKEALIGGARMIGPSTGSKPIGPLVDAYGALRYGDKPVKLENYTVAPSGNSLRFTFTTNGNYGYSAFASKNRSSIENLNPAVPGSDVVVESLEIEDEADREGKEMTLRMTRLDFTSTYYVTVAPYAYGHRYAEASGVKTVNTEENHPPVLNISSELGPFHQYEDVSMPLDITDPDGNSFTVSATSNGPARLVLSSEGHWVFRLDGRNSNPGTYEMTITAKDEFDFSAKKTISYTLLKNRAPVQSKDFEIVHLYAAGEKSEIDVSSYFSDPDGEPLTFGIQYMGRGVFTATQKENQVNIAALNDGYDVIQVTATDALGEKAVAEIPVLVRKPSDEITVMPGNVVTSTLTILPGIEPGEVSVRLVSGTGAIIYNTSGSYSVMNPIVIDVSRCAPGYYTLLSTMGGKQYKQIIIKK